MEEKKRFTIAIVFGNTQAEYSEKLMAGFRRSAEQEQVNLIFVMGPQMPEYCKDILSGSFAWDYSYQFYTVYEYIDFIKPDALIIVYDSFSGFQDASDVRRIARHYKDIPSLVIGDIPEDMEIPHLIVETYTSMSRCVEHLVMDHGYRKIAFVGGAYRDLNSNQCLRAYRDVLMNHGIPLEESLIVYCDRIEMVDAQIEYVLEHNSGLEAIVFAEGMAKHGYKACAKRDILVGHDIAIVGFDDADIANAMEPPLTSGSYSPFLYSHRALQAVLQICRGEKPNLEKISATFSKYASCGCRLTIDHWIPEDKLSLEKLRACVAERVQKVVEKLFVALPNGEEKSWYCRLMQDYFDTLLSVIFERQEKQFSFESLLRYLKKMCDYPYIPKHVLLESLIQILLELSNIMEGRLNHDCIAVINLTRQYINSEETAAVSAEMIDANRKTWFLPLFTADLINAKLGFRENMRLIMERLKAMQVKSTYFFFFQDKQLHQKDEELHLTEELYLAAYYNETEMVCYKKEDWKPLQSIGGFASLISKDQARVYSAFVIFSENEQYGLLLCEVEQKDISFMLVCSVQLGSLQKVLQMKARELKIKRQLEEKNRILNFLSAYDELSQLLNRRGFIEKALRMILKQKGKRAWFLFADIDHLKEINDCFGHAAGDFAIRTAAEYLRHCTPADAVTARIGGDEFISLIVSDRENYAEILTQRLRDYAEDFNKDCEQPFYVEMSAGVYEFICDSKTDISELLSKSDTVLYEQKKRRRSSVRKDSLNACLTDHLSLP